MPRMAALIDAVTSPSWISLMRAPPARISSIRSWWRGRSRTIVVMSLGLRPKASAMARMFSPTGSQGRSCPLATGPTAILRMYTCGKAREAARLADRDHGHRTVVAAGLNATPLERVDGQVDLRPAAADGRLDREGVAVLVAAHDDAVR